MTHIFGSESVRKNASSVGIEPTTSRLTVERANRLRHEDMLRMAEKALYVIGFVIRGYHKIKHFACHRDFFLHEIPRIKHTPNTSFSGIKHFRVSHWLKIG